jgi:intracellular multiplication protein IcmE
MGSFSVEDEYLVLNFDQIIKDGRSYPINGMAVDPATSLPGLATEVDKRYFKRIFLPAASKFIEGVAEAITETGGTSVLSSTTGETVAEETEDLDLNEELMKGVSEASEIVTEMLEEISDGTEILVRVEAGTPFGILFVEPVYESGRTRGPQAGMSGAPSPFGAATSGFSGSGTTNAAAGPAGFDPSMLNLVPDL